mgnify:CR=1 FL=1
MKKGFDNDKYLQMQSEHIRERIAQFDNKLYLEFGGKLFDDYHASRVLPGFQPDSKLQMLLQLKDQAEIVIVISAEDIVSNKVRGDYGITYDTFSSDVRSFPLLSRLIPSATLSKLDSSVEKLQVYMNRTRQVPQLPEVQEEDIHKLILGLLVLKSDVHKETLTVDGQSLECLRFDYSATGEQAGTLLGYLMDTGGLSQGDINASFYLYGKTLVAVRCDGRAGENRAALRLDLGLDAAQGDVSIAVEKLENGEKSAFSYKIGARGADGAHTETAAFGTQSISCDWQPKTGHVRRPLSRAMGHGADASGEIAHFPESFSGAGRFPNPDKGFCGPDRH